MARSTGNQVQQLLQHFSNTNIFSRDELLDFYHRHDPSLNDKTFTWRIYDLKKKHLIRDVGKGWYTLERKEGFHPIPDRFMHRLAEWLGNSLNYHFYNIWTTAWLNTYIELQATSVLYILEVDKESMQGVFYGLNDRHMHDNIFLKPDEDVINFYLSEVKEAVVIEPMISRAPVMNVKKVTVPTLEKILVDLYCDEQLFFAYQGQQLEKIYEACLDKYFINYSRLLAYARRRNREKAIKAFLTERPQLREKIKDILE